MIVPAAVRLSSSATSEAGRGDDVARGGEPAWKGSGRQGEGAACGLPNAVPPKSLVRPASVVISTDGSARRRDKGGRAGGWAFVNHATQETRMGRVASATNNQMELRAVIEAVRSVDPACSIIIRTDSQYVHGAIERGVIRSNAPMWREYEQVSKSRRVKVEWIKGHAGDPHNVLVDRLAGKQAKLAIAELAQNAFVSSVSDCGVIADFPVRHAAWRIRNPVRKARRDAGAEVR